MFTLILGGARSGKSQLAQRLAEPFARVCYVATAAAEDCEMAARIARHRASRPQQWCTVEEPLAIDTAVAAAATSFPVVLVDCLTVWLSNLLYAHRDHPLEYVEQVATEQLIQIAKTARTCRVVLVSNEVGSGIVPESAVGRAFRDLQGRVNQFAAELSDEVALVVAGLPLYLKGAVR